MPRIFIAGVVLFLLLAAAGSSETTQARTVPWDCSDWQAFAHDDRSTAILESLAENRGKTLYCGIDQSDTFAKAETWEAGRDRNERDDTVYQGERGRFRGFIAAQEGWLTEGESGITGQSIAVIFEFPKTGKTVRRTKRFTVGSGSVSDNPDNTCMTDLQAGRQPGTLICTPYQAETGLNNHAGAQRGARRRAMGLNEGDSNRITDWRTNIQYTTDNNHNRGSQHGNQKGLATAAPAAWLARAEAAARSACRARGARVVAGSADFHEGHSRDNGRVTVGSGANWLGDHLGFFVYHSSSQSGAVRYRGRQSRTWSATCIKKIRRTR